VTVASFTYLWVLDCRLLIINPEINVAFSVVIFYGMQNKLDGGCAKLLFSYLYYDGNN
jgi:hypothetical protein